MFSSAFNGWPEGHNFAQSAAFEEMVNVDDALMGAYMQNLLNDHGSQMGSGTYTASGNATAGLLQPLGNGGASLPPSTNPYALLQPQTNAPLPQSTMPLHPNALLPPSTMPPQPSLASYPSLSLAASPLDFPLPAPILPTNSLTTNSLTLPTDPLTLPSARLSQPPAPAPAPTTHLPPPPTSDSPTLNPTRSLSNPSPIDDGMLPMDAVNDTNGLGNSGDTNSGNSSDPSQPGKRRRIRTAKQQVLNKLAQQRYRERRRQRYDDLQKTVDNLTEQLTGLQVLQRENRQLAAANEELRTALSSQQQELQHIRLQLQASSAASGICSAANSAAAKWDYEAIRNQLAEKVAVLRRLLGMLGCLEGRVLRAEQLPQDALVELKGAVAQYCQTCMQLMCAKKPHMAGRMAAADWRALVKGPEEDIRSHWEACLLALDMTEDQKAQLLQLKKEHMERLHALYDERQRLNLTAMGLMLPHPHHGVCADTTPDGKMKCVGTKGQLFCIGHDLDLHKVLDDIKQNLRKEQQGVVELNYLLMHRILDTPQAARLLVQAFPCNIDSLAIAIVLEATMAPADVARLTAPPAKKDPPSEGAKDDTAPLCDDSEPNACSGTSTRGCPKAPSPDAPPSPHRPTVGRPCCSSSLAAATTACS